MTPRAPIVRVLVGVDFDEVSASAVTMAVALASAWDAEVTALHAMVPEAPAYFTANQIAVLEREREQERSAAAERLRTFVGRLTLRPVRVLVEDGSPQDVLLRALPAYDLVVLATHRRQGPRRWWLGSVAEAVVRDSSRPVLVVPAGAVVPDIGRSVTILAAGSDDGTSAWSDALLRAFGGVMHRSPDLSACPPERLRQADLIVLPAPAGPGAPARLGVITQALKACIHPVLFVPAADGTRERSAS